MTSEKYGIFMYATIGFLQLCPCRLYLYKDKYLVQANNEDDREKLEGAMKKSTLEIYIPAKSGNLVKASLETRGCGFSMSTPLSKEVLGHREAVETIEDLSVELESVGFKHDFYTAKVEGSIHKRVDRISFRYAK